MKRYQKRQRGATLRNLGFNIFFLLIFAVLTVYGLYVMREKLLQNAQQLGTSLTQNYADRKSVV